MQNQTFQISDGSFIGLGHYVVNFSTKAVVVGIHTDLNGEQSPILRQVGAGNKLIGGKWVANPKFCSKA
jgi:hypothetical protein